MKRPRCQVIPVPSKSFQILIDGKEVTRWHFGTDYPRPFLFPVVGPSGFSLTRMGHPGAGDHDHHQSVWFAHNMILGINFWANDSPAIIRQSRWLALEDGEEFCRFAVELHWLDGHDPTPLMTQTLIVEVKPKSNSEFCIETWSRFEPSSQQLEWMMTNFGIFAVRVAKEISGHFGGGKISDSEGRVGETAIFGNAARWMDYSGPISESQGTPVIEGLTLFDHPSNVSYPSKWHVREDGWIGPSVCRDRNLMVTKEKCLELRYLLDIHAEGYSQKNAADVAKAFAESNRLSVRKSMRPNVQFEIVREG